MLALGGACLENRAGGDPILDAIARAPLVRRLTPEQHAELAQDLEDIAAGRARLAAQEDVPAMLEEIAGSPQT